MGDKNYVIVTLSGYDNCYHYQNKMCALSVEFKNGSGMYHMTCFSLKIKYYQERDKKLNFYFQVLKGIVS